MWAAHTLGSRCQALFPIGDIESPPPSREPGQRLPSEIRWMSVIQGTIALDKDVFFYHVCLRLPDLRPYAGKSKNPRCESPPSHRGFSFCGTVQCPGGGVSLGLAYLCHLGHTRLKPDALQLSCLEYHDRGWARAPCLLAITVAGMRLDHGAALRSGREIASSARSFAPGWIRSPSV